MRIAEDWHIAVVPVRRQSFWMSDLLRPGIVVGCLESGLGISLRIEVSLRVVSCCLRVRARTFFKVHMITSLWSELLEII